jgi:flavin-dependent dehydrogenase
MTDSDVLIIGAGPAGCTLAYWLASAGISTRILDRASGPVFKIGESLLPEGVRLCREMGLGAALDSGPFLPKFGAQFILSEDGVSDRFDFSEALRAERGDYAYQVKRVDFDALLQEHAQAAGAELRWNVNVRSVDLEQRGHVSAWDSEGGEHRARYLVDASGLAHLVARQLGAAEAIEDLRKVSIFSHFEAVPREEGPRESDIRVLWTAGGWFWVIPFADGTTSVGVVGDPEVIAAAGADDQERFDALAAQSEVHRAVLGQRRQLAPVQRKADYSFRTTARTGRRYLLLGDAGGFLDPIFSTGVYLAQKGAFMARDAILPALSRGELPGEPERAHFTELIEQATDRYLSLVQMFYDEKFMDDVIRSRRRKNTRRALTSILAGDIFDEANTLLRMGMLDS